MNHRAMWSALTSTQVRSVVCPKGARTGGEVLADALLLHGVERAFAVCGESFLPLLDALHDRPALRLVSCRHEAGAAMMAEATAKLNGKPGVCLVSRGPGACHATLGLHTAMQDATPLVLLVGQVPRHYYEREAQQEIEYRRMLGPLAKWVAQIDQVERIPELVHRAFRTAASGRAGPVVLVLPEDMLEDCTNAGDCPPAPLARAYPGADELATMRQLLEGSERPFLIVGGAPWSDAACADILQFAAANDIPICCSYRRLDLVPSGHDCFVGELAVSSNPALVRRLHDADLVLAVGTRLSEPTTQDYTLLNVPVPRAPLVHVYPVAEEIGSVYRPTVAIQSSLIEFAAAVTSIRIARSAARSSWRADLRNVHLNDSAVPATAQPMDPGSAMNWLRTVLPDNAIVTFDAGAFAGWPQRFLRYGRPGRVLAPISGSMNYGLHAGIAAGLAHPERLILVCVGDGGFTMGEMELATARRYGVRMVVLLFNNGQFGSVRIHQERRYPGRGIGTDLTNPDFVMLARSYGAHAETVATTADFAPAWQRAIDCGRTAVIELQVGPDQLSSRVSLTDLRPARRVASPL
ncbi:MAG: thiamine pyrophosphate-binding protein [Casimicrobiaceae bacterium]